MTTTRYKCTLKSGTTFPRGDGTKGDGFVTLYGDGPWGGGKITLADLATREPCPLVLTEGGS
jgi:hypothetical protein